MCYDESDVPFECPQCGYIEPDPDFIYPSSAEIQQQRVDERHAKAVYIVALRSSQPVSYKHYRSKWWKQRHYRRIGTRTAKWAEAQMLKNASAELILSKFLDC